MKIMIFLHGTAIMHKKRITSIVVKEFGRIDHLPDALVELKTDTDLQQLCAFCENKPSYCDLTVQSPPYSVINRLNICLAPGHKWNARR
jgi:hypothetical protein